VIATKAAMGAAYPVKGLIMTTHHDDTEFEPPRSSSPTDHVLQELQLYGYRPFHDEPDPRPLPAGKVVAGAVADIFDTLVFSLSDTRLEPDLENLLWSTVNLFHRAVNRIERELDDNERAQRRSQKEQDGSEVRSVELERLTAEGQTLIERRNSMEFFRDQAADQFERHSGSVWRPRSGSKVNHYTLTSAIIDSRDFLAAKKRADNDAMLETLPIGVMVFPGTGIQDNLADKARKLGIPVWKVGSARRISAAEAAVIYAMVSFSALELFDLLFLAIDIRHVISRGCC
jgi:hypothetical protein